MFVLFWKSVVSGFSFLWQAFTIIDQNRDGIISKDDLRDVLATMGQLNVKNEELEAMVKEASGPINFTVFLTMFGEKLKGVLTNTLTVLFCFSSFHFPLLHKTKKPIPLSGADPEDVIVSAFKVLDPEGTGSIKKEL